MNSSTLTTAITVSFRSGHRAPAITFHIFPTALIYCEWMRFMLSCGRVSVNPENYRGLFSCLVNRLKVVVGVQSYMQSCSIRHDLSFSCYINVMSSPQKPTLIAPTMMNSINSLMYVMPCNTSKPITVTRCNSLRKNIKAKT